MASLTFTETLAAIFNDNRRARRRIWSAKVYVGLDGPTLAIKGFSSTGPDDGKWHSWVITESDYFADDWEVIE